MALIDLLSVSSLAVAEVLLLCAVGALLALPRLNLLSGDGRRYLNSLVFVVFLPALTFYNLGSTVTVANVRQWWFMPINMGLIAVIGAFIGVLVTYLCGTPGKFKRLTVAACAAGNVGNLPLVLMAAICSREDNPFASPPVCEVKAISYVSFSLWPAVVIMWLFVYNLLQPTASNKDRIKHLAASDYIPVESDNNGQTSGKAGAVVAGVDGYVRLKGEPEGGGGGGSKLILASSKMNGLFDGKKQAIIVPIEKSETMPHGCEKVEEKGEEESDAIIVVEMANGSSEPEIDIDIIEQAHVAAATASAASVSRPSSSNSTHYHGVSSQEVPLLRKVSSMATLRSMSFKSVSLIDIAYRKALQIISVIAGNKLVQAICNPPTLAAVVGLAVGCSPPVKAFMFGYGAPLGVVTDAIKILGAAMIPCMMLVLGSGLVRGPTVSGLNVCTILGITMTRLVILPIIGIGVVSFISKIGFLPRNDPLFQFVLMMQWAMPTAINVGTVCTLCKTGEQEIAVVLFWQYILATVSLTGFATIFLIVLF